METPPADHRQREHGAGSRGDDHAASVPLARRGDLRLGATTIRPSIRSIEGPSDSAVAEPRVMQVLLAFIDARGAVLSRDDLMRSCWGGAIVGEDAVNRTVAEIRRISRTIGAGFGVETIPRVGYRLTGYEEPVLLDRAPSSSPLPEPEAALALESSATEADMRPRFSRRWIMGATVATGLAGATGVWWTRRRQDPRFEALMERGRQALRISMPNADVQAATAFRQAANLHPGDAAAWGLLALAQRLVASGATQGDAASANLLAEQAMQRALQLDAREPSALFTQMLMQWRWLDWYAMEKEVRRILAIDPSHPQVLDFLVAMLQAAGYIQESWDHNEATIALDPLRPAPQYRKALKLWIMGQPDAADQQAAFSMENWPLNTFVRNARLLVSAFTGRLRAAHLLLEEPDTARIMLSTSGIAMWKSALAALESQAGADIAKARESCLLTAQQSPALSVHAVLLLSELREVDAAYQVVEGFMLRRGLIVTHDRPSARTEFESDLSWRNTMWLYTPATKALREDSRFALLCDLIGLTEYWKQRGSLPDERRAGA